jgi:hypothetical protein
MRHTACAAAAVLVFGLLACPPVFAGDQKGEEDKVVHADRDPEGGEEVSSRYQTEVRVRYEDKEVSCRLNASNAVQNRCLVRAGGNAKGLQLSSRVLQSVHEVWEGEKKRHYSEAQFHITLSSVAGEKAQLEVEGEAFLALGKETVVMESPEARVTIRVQGVND